MPLASERVVNRPLSGLELKKVISTDIERLLDAEGLLAPHIAFGRVGYTLRLTLHVDNAFAPQSVTTIDSRAVSEKAVEDDSSLGALGPPPLIDPSPEAIVSSHEVHRDVTSPNEERLRAGLRVPVDRRQQDSTIITEMVKYPPDPSIGEGAVQVTDSTESAKIDWEVAKTGKIKRIK